MSDVNAFIDAIGRDINATVVPRIEKLAEGIGAQAHTDYVPKISAFANQLVKEVVDEQSRVVRDFVTALIQDLFQRYRPDIGGDLRTKIVQDGVQLIGEGIKLDLKRRDTGALVASLDIPVSLKLRIDPLTLNIQDATIGLEVVR
jgi:hypothetical protein